MSSIVAQRGAGLADERSEEMTNREGVASGGATSKILMFIVFTHIALLDNTINSTISA